MSKIDDLISRLREEERRALGDARICEEKLEEASRRLELIQAKLIGVLEAKKLTDTEPPKALREPKRRNRALSSHWKKILENVHRNTGNDFGYDDLLGAAAAVGHPTGRDNLRSQMSLYRSAGLIESTDDGRFHLTHAGEKVAEVDVKAEAMPRNENEAPTGGAGGASETRSWSVTSTPTAPSNPHPWRRA